tara:strand:- start:442 stop:837 length:396 start_codon:yes stop_codon:yes gene_type:complete
MKKKQIVIVVVIALVLVGVFLYNQGFFKRNGEEYIEEEEEIICPEYEAQWDQPTSPNLVWLIGGDFIDQVENDTIALGDYNKGVLYAQSRLNSQYSAGIVEDGKFGCETFRAVVILTGYDAVGGFDINDLK